MNYTIKWQKGQQEWYYENRKKDFNRIFAQFVLFSA